MCTVSLIRDEHHVRMICNRDESPRRQPAQPPEIRESGSLRMILPIDPPSDGSWIGVNEAGLMVTLLNHNDAPPPKTKARRSRGTIVPTILSAPTITHASQLVQQLSLDDYAPFRLVATDGQTIGDWIWQGDRLLTFDNESLEEPRLWCSSGLGDARVDRVRRELYEQMVASSLHRLESQRVFHRHAWPDRRELSVAMWRPEAQTVSQTSIDLHADRVVLRYEPFPPGLSADSVAYELPRGRTER